MEERVERGLCLVPEPRELFGDMTVSDNLLLGAYSRSGNGGAMKETCDEVYDRFPRLASAGAATRRHAVGRRAADAGARPCLDGDAEAVDAGRAEPGPGADDRARDLAHRRRPAASGVSILLVEQNARAALETADYGYVLEMGEFALEGPAAELAKNPRVVESYLGLAARTE